MSRELSPTQKKQSDSQRNLVNSGEQNWLVLVAVGIGTLMSALDGSVVNTALPVITQSLGSNIASIEWVVTIYLLVLSSLLISFGRLGDMRGHKPVYLSGFTVFLIGSALCGFAPTVKMLVIFRGVQALGAAMLQANSPAIITKSFPPERRGQALGLVATMTYLGLTIGPSLGGWLTEHFSWRAVFYINIPIGLIAFLMSVRFIHNDKSQKSSEKFDLVGALTFTSGLVLLLFGLNQGHVYGWNSPAIIGIILCSITLLGVFLHIESRASSPMLDLSLFQSRLFSASIASAILNYIAIYGIIFLMPFYLIQGRGFGPAQAGLFLTAQPLIMAIVAPISGSLSDRIGTRIPAFVGMLILSFGLLQLSGLGPESTYSRIVLALFTTGLGTGIFISPNNSALMGAASRERQGIAAGILASARNVGMVLGVGLAGAIFTTLLGAQSDQGLFLATRISFLVTSAVALLGSLVAGIPSRKAKSAKLPHATS